MAEIEEPATDWNYFLHPYVFIDISQSYVGESGESWAAGEVETISVSEIVGQYLNRSARPTGETTSFSHISTRKQFAHIITKRLHFPVASCRDIEVE